MSKHCCCNNRHFNSCNNSNCGDFSNCTVWIFIIAMIFGASGSGNCNFWNSYCNAFGSSAFNATNSHSNINSNFNNISY